MRRSRSSDENRFESFMLGRVRYNAAVDKREVEKLIKLNNDFYRANAGSFSQSRHAGWTGWDRACANMEPPRSVLDVACGNTRFRAFLRERFENGELDYHALDSCPSLLPDDFEGSFEEVDLLSTFVETAFPDELVETAPFDLVKAPSCDLVVCFGFMHHVPTEAFRRALMRFLVGKTAPGGHAIVSFWQFARDDGLRAKAKATTEQGTRELGLNLEEGDYLVGWNNLPGAYRYCHSFTDGEIDSLACSVQGKTAVVDRFRADGRTGQLNCYLVLRRR